MANSDHLERLRKGSVEWNKWRKDHPDIRPDLREANLQKKDLSHYNFRNCDLSNANFSGANCAGADFSKAYLSKANLKGANCQGANFSKANMFSCDLSDANLEKADLFEAILSEAKLKNSRLHSVRLNKANLSQANLSRADLTSAYLSGATLKTATLRGTNLVKANLYGARLEGADLFEANLAGAVCYEANFHKANLENVVFSGANLNSADLSEVNLTNTDFSEARLISCNIFRSLPIKVNFRNTVQEDLVISPPEEPRFSINDWEAAPFAVTAINGESAELPLSLQERIVVALGSFPPDKADYRQVILRALDKRGYVVVYGDLPVEEQAEFNDQISHVGAIARLAVIDISDPDRGLPRLRHLGKALPELTKLPLISMWEYDDALKAWLKNTPALADFVQYNTVEDFEENLNSALNAVAPALNTAAGIPEDQPEQNFASDLPSVAETSAQLQANYPENPDPDQDELTQQDGNILSVGEETEEDSGGAKASERPDPPQEQRLETDMKEDKSSRNEEKKSPEEQEIPDNTPKIEPDPDVKEMAEDSPEPGEEESTATPAEDNAGKPEPEKEKVEPETPEVPQPDALPEEAETEEPEEVEDAVIVVESPAAPVGQASATLPHRALSDQPVVVIQPPLPEDERKPTPRKTNYTPLVMLVVLVALAAAGYWVWKGMQTNLVLQLPGGHGETPALQKLTVFVDGKPVAVSGDVQDARRIVLEGISTGGRQITVFPTPSTGYQTIEGVRYRPFNLKTDLPFGQDSTMLEVAFQPLYAVRKVTKGLFPNINPAGDKIIFIRPTGSFGVRGPDKDLVIYDLTRQEESVVRLRNRDLYTLDWDRPVLAENDSAIYLAYFTGRGNEILRIDRYTGRHQKLSVPVGLRTPNYVVMPGKNGILLGNHIFDFNGQIKKTLSQEEPFQNLIYPGGAGGAVWLEEERLPNGRNLRLNVYHLDGRDGTKDLLFKVFKSTPNFFSSSSDGQWVVVTAYSGVSMQYLTDIRLHQGEEMVELVSDLNDGKVEFEGQKVLHQTEAVVDYQGRRITFEYGNWVYLIDLPEELTMAELKAAYPPEIK